MNTESPLLQIRVHKLDGSVSTFVQDDLETSRQILDAFDPATVFARPKIILEDECSQTVIPIGQITRIDFEVETDSPLSFMTDSIEGVELMPPEFDALIQNLAVHDQWKHLGELDTFVVTFLRLEMADSRNILLTMEVDSLSPQGICELRDFLLSRPSLCFRASSGGVSVLNLSNLCSLTISPGTHEQTEGVWRVHEANGGPTPAFNETATDDDLCPASTAKSPGRLRIKRL
jgi:hypothetical protein